MKSVLLNALFVGSGGFLGTVFRYALSGALHRHFPHAVFPYSTLCVNLLGCFLIGLFTGFASSSQLFGPQLRAFVLIGLLGGFTTFSSFSYETLAIARNGGHLLAALNVGLHVFVGIPLAWLAYGLASSN